MKLMVILIVSLISIPSFAAPHKECPVVQCQVSFWRGLLEVGGYRGYESGTKGHMSSFAKYDPDNGGVVRFGFYEFCGENQCNPAVGEMSLTDGYKVVAGQDSRGNSHSMVCELISWTRVRSNEACPRPVH